MQIHRLFDIVYILLEKKTVTAKELANRFEVSPRTVYRDIDILCGAGIPIYTSRGRGGGISILDSFILNKSTLTDEQQNQILIALQAMRAAGNLEVDEISQRLGNLFHKGDTNWIEVDYSHWGSGEEQKQQFELLKNAIISRQIISFSYYSAAGQSTERRVKPAKLIFKEKAWYLSGFCLTRADWRTFKLFRMKAVTLTGESFLAEELPPPPEIPNQFVSMEDDILMKLKFSESLSYRVLDEFPYEPQEILPDGSIILETYLPGGSWSFGYLLSFGEGLEVLEPESLRLKIKNTLEDMLAKYTTTIESTNIDQVGGFSK